MFISRVQPFREKIAYVSIIYKISSCREQKKNVDLSIFVPPFREKNCLCKHFLQKYRPVEQKKEHESKYNYNKKNSAYTQGDYSGLSYEINIYIPEFHHFEKKLLM